MLPGHPTAARRVPPDRAARTPTPGPRPRSATSCAASRTSATRSSVASCWAQTIGIIVARGLDRTTSFVWVARVPAHGPRPRAVRGADARSRAPAAVPQPQGQRLGRTLAARLSRRSRRSTSTGAGTWRTTATSSAPTSPTSRSTAATRSHATRCGASSCATRPARPAGSSSRACSAASRADGRRRALAGPSHRRGAARAHRDRRSRSAIRGCTSCSGSRRTSRCGASSTGCARSPSTAACSARRTGARRRTRVRQSLGGALHARAAPHRLAPRAPRRLRRPDGAPAQAATPSCGGPGYVTDALEYPQLPRALAQARVADSRAPVAAARATIRRSDVADASTTLAARHASPGAGAPPAPRSDRRRHRARAARPREPRDAPASRRRCEFVVVRDPDVRHQLARIYRQGWSIYKRVLRSRSGDDAAPRGPPVGGRPLRGRARCSSSPCVRGRRPRVPRDRRGRVLRRGVPGGAEPAARGAGARARRAASPPSRCGRAGRRAARSASRARSRRSRSSRSAGRGAAPSRRRSPPVGNLVHLDRFGHQPFRAHARRNPTGMEQRRAPGRRAGGGVTIRHRSDIPVVG